MADEKTARIEQLIKGLHDELAPGTVASTKLREAVTQALRRVDDACQIEVGRCGPARGARPCRGERALNWACFAPAAPNGAGQ